MMTVEDHWSSRIHLSKQEYTSRGESQEPLTCATGKWENLALTIVFPILDKLFEPADHVRFTAVCKRWNSLAEYYKQANQHGPWRTKEHVPPPMLLIRNNTQTTLYSVSEGKVYNNGELPGLPPRTVWCCSSGHGWLATVDELNNQSCVVISLQDPFRKSSPIRLPPLNRLEEHDSYRLIVNKVIMSADPALNPDNYMALALYCTMWYGLALALFKASDGRWYHIKHPAFEFLEAILHKGRVYAIVDTGQIVSVNVDNPGQLCQVTRRMCYLGDYDVHFVETKKGDLLTVQRRRQPDDASVEEEFIVSKLEVNAGDGSIEKSVEVEDIGDEALFVDSMRSVSVSTKSFPRLRRNSIYYIKDNNCVEEINLEDREITKHHELGSHSRGIMSSLFGFITSPFSGLQRASDVPMFLEWHQLPL